jgi:hypothetical protein
LEIELLFAAIGFSLFLTHVTCANDDGGILVRFVNEENRKETSAKGLTKRGVHIFAFDITLLDKTYSGTIQQRLSRFTQINAMLFGKFLFDNLRANDVINLHVQPFYRH